MKRKISAILITVFLLSTLVFANVTDELYSAFSLVNDGSFADDITIAADISKTAGEALQPKNIFVCFIESLKEFTSGKPKNLFMLLSVIFLASLTEVFKSSLGKASGIIDYVSLFTLMLLCFDTLNPLLLSVSDFLVKHTSFMLSLSGSASALLAASGAVSTAVSSSASSSFITAFTEICSVNIILPAVKVIIVLSSVSAISKSVDLSGIINFLKSFCTYGLGLVFSVFLAVHSLTLNIGASNDSLAFRSVRFTVARLVPVAGGMISESIKTVLAGMNVIKSAAGGIGIAYIIYTAIPCIVLVLSLKLSLLCALTVSKILGVRSHAAFIDGINNALSLIFAVCIFASFGGIIILAVFMNTALTV